MSAIKPVIVAFDGCSTGEDVFDMLLKVVNGLIMPEVSHLKFNDALHVPNMSGQALIGYCLKICNSNNYYPKLFLDFKLPDTHGTAWNIVNHYAQDEECREKIDIVTIRENCSLEAYVKLRKLLPNAKITLVSALTDMTEDECRRRNGMSSRHKILIDADNLQYEFDLKYPYKKGQFAIDAVVCSPLEVDFLRRNMRPGVIFITPGIRDEWMEKGQQSRSNGICFALNQGANFVVMGSQVIRGNAKKKISAEESQRRTVVEIEKSHAVQIIPKDLMKTLENCEAFYHCPVEGDKLLGPLVGYAGKDSKTGKNYVGAAYINCAMTEFRPTIRQLFARLLVEKIKVAGLVPDAVMGAPMGATALAFEIGGLLMCPTLTPEKKVIKVADPENGVKEESEMILERHPLGSSLKILLIEDLSNNFSTTDKLINLVESRNSEVIAIACEVNRSNLSNWDGRPVISLVHKPMPQYKQEDPEVIDLIKEGKVVWKPKHNWSTLKKAME